MLILFISDDNSNHVVTSTNNEGLYIRYIEFKIVFLCQELLFEDLTQKVISILCVMI